VFIYQNIAILHGNIPSYLQIKVFECLSYATNVRVSHKFSPLPVP